MKVLIDLNLTPRWVELLAGAGIEAVHWAKVGSKSTPDPGILTYAAKNDFVLLSHDLDLNAILAVSQGGKPSVIQVKVQDPNPDAVGALVVAAFRVAGAEMEKGVLAVIDAPQKRLRMLPLLERKE
jgi:predicted nuclease of predicted toxin-antitoxin system